MAYGCNNEANNFFIFKEQSECRMIKLLGWLSAGSSERIQERCLTQFGGLGNVHERRLHLKLYKVMVKSIGLRPEANSLLSQPQFLQNEGMIKITF